MKPLNLAHRGASAYAPENTMSAFRLAIEMGSDGLEFDVQLTKDAVPIVIHDDRLDRLAGVQKQVSDLTWTEVQQLDVGVWMSDKWKGERIPSLEEVLSTFSPLFLNVELKYSPVDGMVEKVVDMIRQYCRKDRVIVSSFYHPYLKRVRELSTDLKTGILYTEEPDHIIAYARELQASAVHPAYKLLSEEKVQQFRGSGLMVNTWTVNEEIDMNRCIQMGLDGIITNFPDRLRSLITAS